MLSAMLSPRPRVGDLEQRAAARAAVPVFDLVRLSSSSSASSRDLVEHVVVFQYKGIKGIKVEVMVEVLAIWQLLSTSDSDLRFARRQVARLAAHAAPKAAAIRVENKRGANPRVNLPRHVPFGGALVRVFPQLPPAEVLPWGLLAV